MIAGTSEQPVVSIAIRQELEIEAPLETAFQAVLDQLGPHSEMPGGQPFPMQLEAWPGGRWYRDLGGNAGHLWGHVQVIKPPTLLEIVGPLTMSYAAANHVQYRLTKTGDTTRLNFLHRSFGPIQPEHLDGLHSGWELWLGRIRTLAERK